MIYSAPFIPGLSTEHREMVTRLLNVIASKSSRNRLRNKYYDYKQGLKDLGIALPPTMANVETVLGWPAKAVDSMVRRTVLDEWNLPDGLTADQIGISRVIDENRLDTEIPAALTLSLLHATSFGFVSMGDVDAGEPEAMLLLRSAEWATGTWDHRARRLKDALSILSVDENGMPDSMALYVPNLVVMMRRDGARWDLSAVEHDLGVPVEPIPYKPLPPQRPFGSSRVSRPVMALTDSAIRTFVRTEVAAEFYNSPQRYALGLDDDTFTDDNGEKIPGWKIILGHWLQLGRDEDGNLPSVGTFDQQSMEPNAAHFRMISQAFAAETNLPLRSLGVVGENPESAESQQMAEVDQSLEIGHWQKSSLTPALKRLMTYALRIFDDTPAANDVYRRMSPHWKPPHTISVGAAVDAVQKLDAINPGFGASEVGMEMAGMEPQQIARWLDERRRAAAAARSDALLAGMTGAGASNAGPAA